MSLIELYDRFKQNPHVTTDTRKCEPGSIFFALKGANFDGNTFAETALKKGCAWAVVDDVQVAEKNSRMIKVDDGLKALQQLASYHRKTLGTTIVQITGTNGKTTTKELISAVLAEKFNVHSTQGNLNNHIGVPLTLLGMTEKHDIAVIETGANHPGEISMLSNIVQPDCGLITNVGIAHLEGFGSFEGVVRTKCELYHYLRQHTDGFAFVHADNEILRQNCNDLPFYTYGCTGNGYNVEGEALECNPFLKLKWRSKGGEWQIVQTHLVGSYNHANVLAAAAVGLRFGVDESLITKAIENYTPTNHRSEWMKTAHNQLIVDAYNANPTSMAAALDNFSAIKANDKMLIIGEMRELGAASHKAHEKIVKQIKETGISNVWLIGKEYFPYKDLYTWFEDIESAEDWLRTHPVIGKLILVKGSNSTKLYRLPQLL